MKNNITETETLENPEPEKKPFNMYKAIAKLLFAALVIICLLYTAKAAFTDTALENLQENYSSSITTHAKNLAALKVMLEAEKSSADTACSAYKSLKAYKESKKIKLEGKTNPCTEVKAPQEGF